MIQHISLGRVLAVTLTWATMVASPLASAQGLVDCTVQAAGCAAQCAVEGTISSLLAGGDRQGKVAACRKTCDAERQRCQAGQAGSAEGTINQSAAGGPSTVSPSGDTRQLSPQSGGVPGAGSSRSPGAPGVVAFSAKRVTSSDEIVPIDLSTIEDRALIGQSRIAATGGGGSTHHPADQQIARWLALMHIAAQPGTLEDPRQALAAVAMFLPSDELDRFVQCSHGRQSCSALSRQSADEMLRYGFDLHKRRGVVRDWKGNNEFDRPRSHRAFVERYGPILRQQAQSLPQEVLLVNPVRLGTYDAQRGELPFSDGSMKEMFSDSARGLPLIAQYCAVPHIGWPTGVRLTPAEAEAMLAKLQRRQAYIVVQARLERVDGSSLDLHSGFQTQNCKSDARISSVSLYADSALTVRVSELPVPRPASKNANAVLSSRP